MAKAKKKKQQKKRRMQIRTGKLPKDEKTQILLMPPDDNSAKSELFDDEEMDEETGGMYLHKEDIRLIYNALKEYKPVGEENNLHGLLLEEFEELLVVDYGEKLPGFEFILSLRNIGTRLVGKSHSIEAIHVWYRTCVCT
jgi:hypothetical protein